MDIVAALHLADGIGAIANGILIGRTAIQRADDGNSRQHMEAASRATRGLDGEDQSRSATNRSHAGAALEPRPMNWNGAIALIVLSSPFALDWVIRTAWTQGARRLELRRARRARWLADPSGGS